MFKLDPAQIARMGGVTPLSNAYGMTVPRVHSVGFEKCEGLGSFFLPVHRLEAILCDTRFTKQNYRLVKNLTPKNYFQLPNS